MTDCGTSHIFTCRPIVSASVSDRQIQPAAVSQPDTGLHQLSASVMSSVLSELTRWGCGYSPRSADQKAHSDCVVRGASIDVRGLKEPSFIHWSPLIYVKRSMCFCRTLSSHKRMQSKLMHGCRPIRGLAGRGLFIFCDENIPAWVCTDTRCAKTHCNTYSSRSTAMLACRLISWSFIVRLPSLFYLLNYSCMRYTPTTRLSRCITLAAKLTITALT